MTTSLPPTRFGHGLPEPLEALLLASAAVTQPYDRLVHLSAALEALLKTLVGIAMADLIQACRAPQSHVRYQLEILSKGNSDGTWLTALQSLARELGKHPNSWLGARWNDLGNGGSPVVRALVAAVVKRNEHAHTRFLERLHSRANAAEMQEHLAEALAHLPWLLDLAVVRPRDIQPTVLGYDGALLVAGPKPERLDGRWTGKVLPDFLYLYDRAQQRLLCLHPWLVPVGHELAGVQRALVVDDLRNWPKLAWKNAAVSEPEVKADVGRGTDLAAWLMQLVPEEARGASVEIRQPSGAFASMARPARPAQAATSTDRASPPPLAANQQKPVQPVTPEQPVATVPTTLPGMGARALPPCSGCAGVLRALPTGLKQPIRGCILLCASCQSVYHTQHEPMQLSQSSPLRRLWAPQAPRVLTTVHQAELHRPNDHKTKVIKELPYAFARAGSAQTAAWLGRMDDGRWLVVAAQGVPLRDDHGVCEAAQLAAGSRFWLNGMEMVLTRGP